MPLHKKRIEYRLNQVAERYDEVLLTKLAGIMFFKIPKVKLPGFDGDYLEAQGRHYMSILIGHILMDSNAVLNKIQHKKNAEGKWETLTLLYLGGDETKQLLKGVHYKPGVFTQKRVFGLKLQKRDKDRGKKLASIPFQITDVASAELIMHGYKLKADWNLRVDKTGRKLPEDFNTKVERYQGYANLIMDLGNPFYLEMKYSGSGRMFYLCQLEGMRPQGKLWETLMIDSAEAYHLDESELGVLKQVIYNTLSGERVTIKAAELFLTDEMVDMALEIDPMEVEEEEAFGEALLLLKAARALRDAQEGLPTHYMFGFDFTNSGLIMAGLSFKSPEMMECGNIHGRYDVVDAHGNFGRAFDLDMSRKDIKKVHMPLLHGATLQGLRKRVHEITGKDISIKEIRQKLVDAYGQCVSNLTDIADWGVQIVDNNQTEFSWSMPDGFTAWHRAYFEAVSMQITVPSAHPDHPSGKTTHRIISDMPYRWNNRGQSYHMDTGETPKVRGLYAAITHAIDAFVLRFIVDNLLEWGRPVLLKHDDYMIHPSDHARLFELAREIFHELFQVNLYQEAINQIAATAVSKPPALTVMTGNADNLIDQSESFLMP